MEHKIRKLKNRMRWIIGFLISSLVMILVTTNLMFGLLSSSKNFLAYYSLWSHSYNNALIYLISYSADGNEYDLIMFHENLRVVDGIQNALYELNMDKYDEEYVLLQLESTRMMTDDLRGKVSQLHMLRNFPTYKHIFEKWEEYHVNAEELREIAFEMESQFKNNLTEGSMTSVVLGMVRDINFRLLEEQVNLAEVLEEASEKLKNRSILLLIVLSLGISIMGGVMLLSWKKNAYSLFEVSSERDRLASFPKLNPNQIIVLDHEGGVNYKNQSASTLLKKATSNQKEVFIGELNKVAQKLFETDHNSSTFEIEFMHNHYIVYSFRYYSEKLFHFYLVDITDKKKLEIELKQSLLEKTILLSEIHHRVKNNLAIAIGLLEIEILDIDDEKATKILKRSANRLHSIASVHKLLYDQKDLSRILLSDFTDTIVEIGNRNSGRKLEISCSGIGRDTRININQGVTFAMLLNELIYQAGSDRPGEKHVKIELGVNENNRLHCKMYSEGGRWKLNSENDSFIQLNAAQLEATDFEIDDKMNLISFSFALGETSGVSSSLPEEFSPSHL